MTGIGEGWVGSHFHRKEDHRLTTGKGPFPRRHRAAGCAPSWSSSGATTRMPLIKSIDVSAAKAMKGVVAVVTGEDIKDEILPMPQPVVQPALPATYPKHWPLAVGKVKWHGEPVAAVIARDPYVAEDAAETIEVELRPAALRGRCRERARRRCNHRPRGLAGQRHLPDGLHRRRGRGEPAGARGQGPGGLRQRRYRDQAALHLPPLRRGAHGDARRALRVGRVRRAHRLAHHPAPAYRQARALGHSRNPGREDPHHRAARPGRRLRRQGAVLPRAHADRLHGEEAGTPGSLDRDPPGAPDGGESGARPDPRSRGRGGERRQVAGDPRSRPRRLRRRLRGGLLGLPDALPRRGRACPTATTGRSATSR